MRNTIRLLMTSMAAASAFWMALPGLARAHCDTMDGPVVADARMALGKGDIAPVLKWVKPEAEREITEAFNRAIAVRGKGQEAQDLADLYFFETLVRIHRQGEGAPYTGLKPAGIEIEPAIKGSDKALETGSVDTLVKELTDVVEQGVRERFERASKARAHAEHNVEAGRHFVEAYVEFMHYVERLHNDAMTDAAHHSGDSAGNAQHAH